MSLPQAILIHGALGNAHQMKALEQRLSSNFNVSIFEIPYHGYNASIDYAKFNMVSFAEALIHFILNKKSNMPPYLVIAWAVIWH